MIIPYVFNNYFLPFVPLPDNCQKPPTLYSVLNSIVNGGKIPDDYVQIKDLAKVGRTTIFNFDYPLSQNIDKEKFESMILNHFLQRRIGFETVTAFRIQLDVKLNEIMPIYNKMFDALENWDIFNDGETTTRTGTDEKIGESHNTSINSLTNDSSLNSSNISDRRYANLPQNELDDIRDGKYLTDYNYDNNNSESSDHMASSGSSQSNDNSTNNSTYSETIKRSPSDKILILKEMQENINNIYTMIFKDLDCLFYQLV